MVGDLDWRRGGTPGPRRGRDMLGRRCEGSWYRFREGEDVVGRVRVAKAWIIKVLMLLDQRLSFGRGEWNQSSANDDDADTELDRLTLRLQNGIAISKEHSIRKCFIEQKK